MFCVPTHFELSVEWSAAKKNPVIIRLFEQASTKYSECAHTSSKSSTNNNPESESEKEEYMSFALFNLDSTV